MAIVRGCAYAELGDTANLDRQLTSLKAYSAENTTALFETLLCTKDKDALAAEILVRLRDPATRSGMLYSLQDYLVPSHETAADREERLRLKEVRARVDVAAEIDKVGRVGSWPLQSPLH
jgi:hypothetical protein